MMFSRFRFLLTLIRAIIESYLRAPYYSPCTNFNDKPKNEKSKTIVLEIQIFS